MDATSLLTVPIWESRCSVLLVSKARDNRTDSGFIPLAVTKISPKGIVEYGPDWKGFLFHHFGGPGASAIKELWKNARSIRALAEGYSLIAVDNRGVILSGPNTNCFEDLWEVYYARSKPEHGNRTLDLSDEEMLKMELLLAEEANLRCYRKLGGLDGSLRYIGTEDVARDTISVFQALANFNERQKLPIPKVLHLFGESYGGRSALTTLALFPEWIGKVLIDCEYALALLQGFVFDSEPFTDQHSYHVVPGSLELYRLHPKFGRRDRTVAGISLSTMLENRRL